MKRNLATPIQKDITNKMILLSGPRQVGKTTLSQSIVDQNQYLNFDFEDHRKIILQKTWDRTQEVIIFDELHKKPKWKSWIKGIYDVENKPPHFLITGSARMDIFKKGSDSLAGRHFKFRLHPFSVAELKEQIKPEEAFETILRCGGFPEPFLNGGQEFASRWRRTHIDQILKQDLLETEQVRQLKALEILIDLLAERVGSPISYASLARDLEVSPHTIKRWIELLEAFFIIFIVPPMSENVARAIQKEPKIYFYDNGKVKSDPAARLENCVACALLKDIHFQEDTKGVKGELYYVRDKEKHEVDFLVMRERKIESLIEVKLTDTTFSKHLLYFTEKLKPLNAFQLVGNLKTSQTRKVNSSSHSNLVMRSAVDYLQMLEV
jgi:predicted AAA+ superfamily ATPase